MTQTPRQPLDRTVLRVIAVAPASQQHWVDHIIASGSAAMEVVGRVVVTRGASVDAMSHELAAAMSRGADEAPACSVVACLPGELRTRADDLHEVAIAAGAQWRMVLSPDELLSPELSANGQAVSPPPTPMPARHIDAGDIDTLTLINRRPHPLDEAAIRGAIENRCVLITGAGGSIGSELARMVGRFNPSRLILAERSENALFEIDRQIRHLFPDMARSSVLHDVTHLPRTRQLVETHRPNVVFHAAAHKHVPVMEDHPMDAVENNFFGTRSIADACDACGVDRFVMISTDKAVNPTSVMGATKRLAELYVQWLNQRSKSRFSMVRFGNVLGSACSVLPIWTKQLAHGGPITVTHADMQRYFMTIPEAAGLVIQSAAYTGATRSTRPPPPELETSGDATSLRKPTRRATDIDSRAMHAGGGEVFLLDMGEPVRILDLAHRFARLHGLEPGRDIDIRITGIRPGEKLYEELACDGEDMIPTPHRSIHIWQSTPPTNARMQRIVASFERLRATPQSAGSSWIQASRDAVLAALMAAIPEMQTREAVIVRAAAG